MKSCLGRKSKNYSQFQKDSNPPYHSTLMEYPSNSLSKKMDHLSLSHSQPLPISLAPSVQPSNVFYISRPSPQPPLYSSTIPPSPSLFPSLLPSSPSSLLNLVKHNLQSISSPSRRGIKSIIISKRFSRVEEEGREWSVTRK